MKYLIYLAIFLVAAGSVIYLFRRGTPPIEVTPEVRERLAEVAPTLSDDENAYFSLLEANAVSGGPPKDGIPSIDNPRYESAIDADSWLLPDDVVFGTDYDGFVAAYPQRILVWHEIVNEEVNGEKIAVTYCPLTGTAIGFKGEYVPQISAQFGVSGKLVNSNLIMYDRVSDSYWPQILGRAITGPAAGISLDEFPVIWTTWERWKKIHPDTLVLSRDTGFFRNYGEGGDPYGSYLREDKGYYASDRMIFKPVHQDERLHPKEVVIGIRDAEGNALAILRDKLRGEGSVEAILGEETVSVTYDPELDFYTAQMGEQEINAFDAFWFAWVAFYPDTELIE